MRVVWLLCRILIKALQFALPPRNEFTSDGTQGVWASYQ
jgi:hypothetical protein